MHIIIYCIKKIRFLPQALLLLCFHLTCTTSFSQSSVYNVRFLDNQKSFPKISEMMSREEDTLQKQFQAKQLVWPARFVYIRSFKYDSEMEVWVKNKQSEKYKYFKTYKICALAGSLGPKRMAGDYQVPEGFYYINEFNPRSLYHLSLGLNYPNASDRMLCDLSQPGGDIYIHGSCVTTGCIPITDGQIEELYVLAAHAKDMGQDFIPVHIFPVNFDNPKSVAYLNHFLTNFNEYVPFEKSMQNAFYYFEKNHQVPPVIVNSKGEYVIEEVGVPAVLSPKTDSWTTKKLSHPVQPIPEEELAVSVDKLPLFPGGNQAFKVFIDKLSADMIKELEPGQTKAFILMEYIIDENGKTIFANAISGGNDKMNLKIEKAFTNMALWTPAVRQGKNVPIKLKQNIMVEAP
ncbi:MAG TPA: L,D-transpeptidase family protein [Puia sp.]|nr:L,D-transpeptidase family protein [Puia sp.]